ncbi:PDDEXK nuclease domain-containing protein [Lacibacter sp.]|uniref:PDDEXK nuclease domain-containing protein n=1 Tax=Lacibacter sp. TaxID=1915409 RepID=UPI002B4B9375|nr:PDDEXK nuclease domain-containing protein [Lacibacter sp.]HLP37587.1 PDDEXK nuclease domain-containing protein [Lacibacter sp.]
MQIDRTYVDLITSIKKQIIQSRYNAARLANSEQLMLYFKTGLMISEKIKAQKWGAKVLDQISADLQKELPGLKGFSPGNLKKIRLFAEAYTPYLTIGSAATNQLQQPASEGFSISSSLTNQFENNAFCETFTSVSFTHHFTIITKIKTLEARIFYIQSTASNLWSVTVLEHHIANNLFGKEGKLPNNFGGTLAENLKTSAIKMFKDEYLLDFIAGDELDDERHIEQQVVLNIRNFILQMGKGFCFIGNQYRLEVDDDEFFIDLLFFNRYLQCLVAFELKKGKFKPADAGQLNFYLNVLDEKVKLQHENSSIGIVLCKEKNNTVVEFAIKSFDKAMGVATYKTSKQTPVHMKGILPNTDRLGELLE